MSQDCMYCARDERLTNLMIEVAPMRVSTLYLFREQTYRGRCIVALNDHERELFQLSPEAQESYLRDIAQAAKAVHTAFAPDKINYGAFGDMMPHVHFHIVPKYKDGYTWGKMFEMNPAGNEQLSDAEYEEIIARLRAAL
ncbi:hypothetical protein PAESOLCIP111_03688 [Paenibacillus solanacearum]|uniref:HIT domain-containing protein n=1 Tax=Paenibacillus solanacearum TaxID=2048548 RepID=A0A916K2Z2_9BACL|nr:HIT family protein [Paenibacillus solanacearum]CAG7635649.1 hypothetical protein PAESOLCIP111_03688 [Paenibacillus solanacearum]